MEQPCHQCGAAVEDGTPFCKHCGAPQIRIPDEDHASEPLPPGTPADIQPPAEPVGIAGGNPAATAAVDWGQAVPAAAAAGLFLAVAAVIPSLGFLFWLLAGGALGVLMYRRRVQQSELTPSFGARIGAITGVFGFAIFAVIFGLQMLATRGSGTLREMLQQVIQQAAARNSDPRAQQAVQALMSPAGMALLFTLVLVFFLIAFVALSSIGGTIGAWLLRKRSVRKED